MVFEARSPRAKFHAPNCRLRAHRMGLDLSPCPAPPGERGPERVSAPLGTVEYATAAVLAAAGRTETPAGQVGLALARRIDASDGESGAGLAALAKQHQACLADALRDADRAATDPLDELRAARERRAAG